MDRFDELLLQVIDKTVRYSFGEINAEIIYDYLAKRGVPKHAIPRKLEVFSMELRYMLGSDSDQILGVAPVLEETILEAFCIQLKIELSAASSAPFANRVRMIKEVYNDQDKMSAQIANETGSLKHNVPPEELSVQKNGGEN